MLFNSLSYAVFLPIVFILYWLVSNRFRWLFLLVVSYYFYMGWEAKYAVIIFITTLVSYLAGLLLEKAKSRQEKKAILFITGLVCMGILVYFKYFNFISESVSELLSVFSIRLNPVTLKVILPVGISFFTFQTFSYVIDVYKGQISAEHHFGKYAAFVSFFPQLVAGPIERASNLLSQINMNHSFNYEKAMHGAKLMLWGFFKKLMIADIVSVYVNQVYNSPYEYSQWSLILATVLFAIQIYCDFSGYSDIAIGTAQLMDYDLTTNFKSPYFSTSIKEFWNRWHISLSTWFRDYVYIPLGGNRCSRIRQSFNLLVTFLVSGIWHGANWTYIIWGLIHGIGQIIENVLKKPLSNVRKNPFGKVISVAFVFSFACFAWIFFRANSLSEAFYILKSVLTGTQGTLSVLTISVFDQYLIVSGIVALFVYDYLNRNDDVIYRMEKIPAVFRWSLYLVLALVIVFFSQKGAAAQFVYFQF